MSRQSRIWVLTLVGIWLAGALPAAADDGAAETVMPDTAGQSAVEEILAADRAFAARSAEMGPARAFVDFAAEDVRTFPEGRTVRKGKAALVESASKWPEDLVILWDPQEAVAGAAGAVGDVGYSWGYAEIQSRKEDGSTAITYSKYVTIWQKQADGSWKWIADIGNPAPPPDKR